MKYKGMIYRLVSYLLADRVEFSRWERYILSIIVLEMFPIAYFHTSEEMDCIKQCIDEVIESNRSKRG